MSAVQEAFPKTWVSLAFAKEPGFELPLMVLRGNLHSLQGT